ncbi:GAF domain-containing protein [Mycolicibacterium brumae]|uniref:Transcriptional regulator n=1 Tax=Mycolicibacterium brumae TaxID=85968 RepID=A0A2G5PH96_9MYCO|nr:GAF domain-containing protein [Mycolicibacterium brumae]MCV7194519.1 GAF domain-containing protein [Mycolicibacterium brumae]PIB77682.1 transcriptional regulator [Mycolicibacterium brumae]RWA20124.1 hypothetical protein MBRU_15950 [Mycolicibacterium brumae DSM 44177]UWW10054.1 GAF domain-containing protein [Mycolicibacterium brumae]
MAKAALRSPDRTSARAVLAAHDLFVTGEVDAPALDQTVRSVVARSWQRSRDSGVDPDRVARATDVPLDQLRAAHPLAAALPVIRRLLVQDALDAGVVVAVTDADGALLWVEGDPRACRRVEAMNFVPGADWSERAAGTNAPGTALALDGEVQIRGAEHFSRIARTWSCTAVPVHDPDTGAALGAIDLTGGARVASAQTLALVRATATAVENHLALLRLTGASAAPSAGPPHLAVLGAERPRWITGSDSGCPRVATLTGRHADILVLLSRHPEGLSADHLAMLLDERDLDVVTVRAEMSRLRKVIGPAHLASRPYRLLEPITSDVGGVFAALDSGDVRAAVCGYPGPLLPQSVSPAVARLRAELSAALRAAALAECELGDDTALRRWLALPEGRDDRRGWQLLRDGAPDVSARARAAGQMAGIDYEFGSE